MKGLDELNDIKSELAKLAAECDREIEQRRDLILQLGQQINAFERQRQDVAAKLEQVEEFIGFEQAAHALRAICAGKA